MRIGIIGTGRIVSRFISEAETVDKVNVTAIYNPHIETVKFFAQKNNVEGTQDINEAKSSDKVLLTDSKADMYQVCDAVYVASPHEYHVEDMKDAISAGKHVLCEKPLALNASDAREMFAVAKENNVILMEAYAYHHSPYIQSLKDDIKSGVIGDVEFVDTAFFTQYYVEDIRMYKELGGGAVYDLGCYCTTMILSLVDSAPDFVMAKAEFNDKGADVLASVILKFENGARAVFNVGMIFDPGSNRRKDILYVHGSKGTIVSDVEYNQEGKVSYTVTSGSKVYTPSINVPHNYMLETEQLGRCIENGEALHITPEFSIKNAELLDEILKQIGY